MAHSESNKPRNMTTFERKNTSISRIIWDTLCTSLLVCYLYGAGQAEQFGPAQGDKVSSELFANKGKVYVETFRIEGLNATLSVRIEDVIGIAEYWLLDFQPYQYDPLNLPISEVSGFLSASNTGQCSSIEQDQDWNDLYFDDEFFQNHSAIGSKLLFTDYIRGNGIMNGIRADIIKFEGKMNTFLTCEQTDGISIWESNIYAEEIEYNTVLYATNLRPQPTWEPDTSNDLPAVGFVQNNIHLIWRLARVAIVNFIITSKAIEHIDLFAIFDYAIVEPVLLDDGLTPDIEHTKLTMGFTTYVPIEQAIMLVWIDNTVTYTPRNPENTLTEVVEDPPSVLANTPPCNTMRDPDYCLQSWDYEFVLLLDITQLTLDMPLEATGVFGFDFNLFECTDVATATGCILKVDVEEPFNVKIDLTLQSTVAALDEAGDSIEVEIIGVTNDAGEDVRNGVVDSGENITMEVVFYPAFMRDEYSLDLQLFMVCKGAELADDARGCLAAPEEERFTSFISPDLSYPYDAREDPNFLLNPTTPPPPVDEGTCKVGWSKFNSKCYFFEHRARVTYAQASSECNSREAELVTITSQEEQDFLVGGLKYFGIGDGGYYIGLNDRGAEGIFAWSDGTPFKSRTSFTSWDGGEPNNVGNEDCVGLKPASGGDWNDYRCSEDLLAYICLKPSDRWSEWTFWTMCSVTCGSGTRSRTRTCESSDMSDCLGSALHTQKCLMSSCDLYKNSQGEVVRYESTDIDMDYYDSVEYCQSKGGKLANINSRGLQSHLLQDYEYLMYPKAISLVGLQATQSSTEYEGDAYLAIDGIKDSSYTAGSCTHTAQAYGSSTAFLVAPQWWMVDLVGTYCISKVSIVNRADCCYERLIDSIVKIGDDSNVYNNPQCGSPVSEKQAGPGVTVNVLCEEPICGQYVSIHSGFGVDYGILTLCEVMVYGYNAENNLDEACLEENTIGWAVQDRTNITSSLQTFAYPDQIIPCDGLVTAMSFWAIDTGSLALLIWRPVGSSNSFDIVGSVFIESDEIGLNKYSIPEKDQIPVKNGDVLGLAWDQPVVVYELEDGSEGASEQLWMSNNGDLEYERDARYVLDNTQVGVSVSLSVTVQPHDEDVPYYWVDGYQAISQCSSSGSSESSLSSWSDEEYCPILSDCDTRGIYVPCSRSLRAICEYDNVLAFHAIGGNSENVLSLWASTEAHESYSRVKEGHHYKSHLVEDWDEQVIGVDEVKVVLQRYGQDVLTLTFDGTASNKYDWFTPERLINSPYDEIADYNSFSIRGPHDEGNPYRHFYINHRYGACTNDIGWLVVLEEQDPGFNGCAYELAVPPEKPAFLYSDGQAATRWMDAQVADAFLIYIKYKELAVSASSGYDLAFRGVAGSGQDILGLWESPSYSDSAGRITYWQHFKSPLVEKWDRFLITVSEVKVQLRTNGDTLFEMSFDGENSNKNDWFTFSRLILSPFDSLNQDTYTNYFSLQGHSVINRHFFINENYLGCPEDRGWFVVIDHGSYHPCKWDNSHGTGFPKFLYSQSGSSTSWESGSVGAADEFLIFIKYTNDPLAAPTPTYPAPTVYSADNVSPVLAGRELTVSEYNTDRDVHQSKYTCSPLAAERVTTTMTAVYTLVPKDGRRKRDIRHRRNLIASLQLPQLQTVSFGTNGCPPYSSFNPVEFSCNCWTGYHYNAKTFLCDEDVQMDDQRNITVVNHKYNGTLRESETDMEEAEGTRSQAAHVALDYYSIILSLFSGVYWLNLHKL
ncbi:uncharacterized protein [Amphiura filiformis]|uniref:uncharacterized protein n=1 Tax=Amphiura filiformis TaxID=82378 RepID=UPI003B21EA1D